MGCHGNHPIFWGAIGGVVWYYVYWKPRRAAVAIHTKAIEYKRAFEENIPTLEAHLSHALSEFDANAYRPFWVCMEKIASLKNLLVNTSSRYSALEGSYRSKTGFRYQNLPTLPPLGANDVTKFTTLSALAAELYRTAQRDFKFAAILEMWQNRQALDAITEEVQMTKHAIGEMHESVKAAQTTSAELMQRQTEISGEQLETAKSVKADVELIRKKLTGR